MSGLYQIRTAIRDLLIQDGLWDSSEVIVKRRSNIWNDVAVATNNSASGQCLVVGVAKGSADKGQKSHSQQLLMEITVPLTLVELPSVSPDEDPSEDERWEATVMRLLGSPLGRSPIHYELVFDGFADVEDEDYVIRQTTFKTTLLLKTPIAAGSV